jgi:hypothetical protein
VKIPLIDLIIEILSINRMVGDLTLPVSCGHRKLSWELAKTRTLWAVSFTGLLGQGCYIARRDPHFLFPLRGNYRMLKSVLQHAQKAWRYWLIRRSHTSATPWEKFQKLQDVSPFPAPRIVHNIRANGKDNGGQEFPVRAELVEA